MRHRTRGSLSASLGQGLRFVDFGWFFAIGRVPRAESLVHKTLKLMGFSQALDTRLSALDPVGSLDFETSEGRGPRAA